MVSELVPVKPSRTRPATPASSAQPAYETNVVTASGTPDAREAGPLVPSANTYRPIREKCSSHAHTALTPSQSRKLCGTPSSVLLASASRSGMLADFGAPLV